MIAIVERNYTDKFDESLHLVGESVELTEERFTELSTAGYVSEPTEEQAKEPTEPEPETEAVDEEPATVPNMDWTVPELRAEAARRGVELPKKATKQEILDALEA